MSELLLKFLEINITINFLDYDPAIEDIEEELRF